jgi:hypothetical protein
MEVICSPKTLVTGYKITWHQKTITYSKSPQLNMKPISREALKGKPDSFLGVNEWNVCDGGKSVCKVGVGTGETE